GGAGADADHGGALDGARLGAGAAASGAPPRQLPGLPALGCPPAAGWAGAGETDARLLLAGTDAGVTAGARLRHVHRAVVHSDLPRVVQVVGDDGHGAGLLTAVPTLLPALVAVPLIVVLVVAVVAIGVVPAVRAGGRGEADDHRHRERGRGECLSFPHDPPWIVRERTAPNGLRVPTPGRTYTGKTTERSGASTLNISRVSP